ncbi:MAG: hypothetical protein IKQ57_04175, partial [Candidatus Methanomethylophilaceae archaeon]|nr:hypothetical protein [Candidatus Methanomethylophilaceae archaeon]
VALTLDTMAICLSWTGTIFPEMVIGLDRLDRHDASGDVSEDGIDRLDGSIMLCCLAAGMLSLSIFAAWLTI